jgi:hypothetical protein
LKIDEIILVCYEGADRYSIAELQMSDELSCPSRPSPSASFLLTTAMISYDQEEDPGDMLAEHELEVKGMPAMKPIVDIFEQFKERDEIDNKMGFERFVEGPMKLGWLINIQSTLIDDASPQGRSGVELYFLEDDGGSFKATLLYEPYFYIICKVRKF